METLLEGAALAVLVVFLFLRDWRATIISAIAIPLSAIPTFWFMSLLGFTLNTMTLMALGLVAGVLVDDAIVEIENIVRHMRMGKTAYQAAIDAADEIGLAVVGTTFSIVAVFLPVGLMPDVAGEYFRNFGFTVVAAVLISLGVARLITPMMAAYFLHAKGHAKHGEGWMMDKYMSTLAFTLRHRWLTVVGGFVALVLTVLAFMMMPQTFFPDTDQDFTSVTVEMVPGTTMEQTGAAARQVEQVIRSQPEVASVFTRVRVGSATVSAMLKDRSERVRTSQEFERQVTPQLSRIADARAFFRSQQTGGRALNIMLGGDDPVQLNQVAQRLV
jgi:multidrug efflux pump subunit AcrB